MQKIYPILIVLLFTMSTGIVHANDQNSSDQQMLLVHKTPTCGCCKKWMEHLKENGITTYAQDHGSMEEIKQMYDIKPKYRSCHTGVSTDGYIFEGHIPSRFITQFLSEDHPNAIGLSVPGMPLGSPGMEVENRFMPYEVLILFKDGTSEVYASVTN